MADEDDIDLLVAALQEQMQQDEEPLGEILLVLAHRARHVHQAEHDRLGAGLGLRLEALVAQIERIDIGDDALAPLELLQLDAQLGQALQHARVALALGLQRLQLLAHRLDLVVHGTLERHAPADAVAHGAQRR